MKKKNEHKQFFHSIMVTGWLTGRPRKTNKTSNLTENPQISL